MERKHIVMIALGLLLVASILDFSWYKADVFENFFGKIDMYHVSGGLAIDESTPSAKGDREFNLDSVGIEKLVINNSYGNIKLEGTQTEEIRVQIELTVYADEQEQAQEVLAELVVNQEQKDGTIIFGLEDERVLPLGIKGIWAHYTVYVPERLALHLTSQGDLSVNNIDGKVKLANHYGDTIITGIDNDLELDQRSGVTKIQDITGQMDLRINFGDLTLEKTTGDLEIKGTHANMELLNIMGSVRCDGSFGELQARDITGDLIANLRHTPIKAENISGHVEVDTSFGDVKLVNVAKGINVENEHANIVIRTTYNHRVDAETSHGQIYVRGDELEVEQDEQDRYTYQARGIMGEGEYRMDLKNRFGNIDIE